MAMMFCKACGKELHESAPMCPHCGAPQRPAATGKEKSQTVAALLCAFLGGFGAHRFYLGPVWLGVVSLLLFWTGIPALIAFFETFFIVFSSQEAWARKHNNGVITEPAHLIVKILVLIFPILAFIGILAAIAIPQYADYVQKAKTAQVVSVLNGAKIKLTEHLLEKKGAPLDEATLNDIKATGAGDKNIVSMDAFAFGQYADVGARIVERKQEGALHLVTRDGGQSWSCLVIGHLRLVPKSCVPTEGLQRPTIPKPVPKLGQWNEDFYQAALEGCSRRALEGGNEAGPETCKCVLTKAAFSIPQEQMQAAEALPQIKEQMLEFANECRPI